MLFGHFIDLVHIVVCLNLFKRHGTVTIDSTFEGSSLVGVVCSDLHESLSKDLEAARFIQIDKGCAFNSELLVNSIDLKWLLSGKLRFEVSVA